MSHPGPWRRGGQAKLPDGADDFIELKTGTDIWSPEGPVTMLEDWFDDEDIDLMAQAPTLRDDVSRLTARVAELEGELAILRALFPNTSKAYDENARLAVQLEEARELLKNTSEMGRTPLDICRRHGPSCVSAGDVTPCWPCRRRALLSAPAAVGAVQGEGPRCEPWCGTPTQGSGWWKAGDSARYCKSECSQAGRPLHPSGAL